MKKNKNKPTSLLDLYIAVILSLIALMYFVYQLAQVVRR